MQNTRLNTLIGGLNQQLQVLLRNPWRRISVIVIAFLFGIYLGMALSAIAGQAASFDTTAAGLVLLAMELISWLYYNNRWNARNSLWGAALNALKLGTIYGLFVIAFMLGS